MCKMWRTMFHTMFLIFMIPDSLCFVVRSRRRLELKEEECEQESMIISPTMGQSTTGQNMIIVQNDDEDDDTDDEFDQPVEIISCVSPGSSCAGCEEQDTTVNKICMNTYTVSQHMTHITQYQRVSVSGGEIESKR